MTSYLLEHLGDRELLEGLTRVTRSVRHHMAEILAHLAEVDRRRLYLEQGCSSLFTYAVEVLHFSEDEAGKRIQAARVARQYPLVFEMIANGELHLTAVNLLAPHLTPATHAGLLAAARHASKRQVEELVAAHAPRPDAVTRLARLPASKLVSEPLRGPSAGGASVTTPTDATTVTEPRAVPADTSSPLAADGIAQRGTSSHGAEGIEHGASSTLAPERGEQATTSPPPLAVVAAASAAGPRPSVKPLAPGRYRLQLTLSDEGRRALLRARDLMRHQNPSGDLAVVVERALVEIADSLEARKLGKLRRRNRRDSAASATRSTAKSSDGVDRHCEAAGGGRAGSSAVARARSCTDGRGAAPERARGEHAPEQVAPPACARQAPPPQAIAPVPTAGEVPTRHAPEQTALSLGAPGSGRADGPSRRSGRDPAVTARAPGPVRSSRRSVGRAVRRQVAERDDGRCTFVSSSGHRCTERGFLELHHTTPVARGGAGNVDGLALLCRAHHRLVTESDFGEPYVRRCIERRSEAASRRPTAPAGC